MSLYTRVHTLCTYYSCLCIYTRSNATGIGYRMGDSTLNALYMHVCTVIYICIHRYRSCNLLAFVYKHVGLRQCYREGADGSIYNKQYTYICTYVHVHPNTQICMYA